VTQSHQHVVENYEAVLADLAEAARASGRNPDEVRLVAVAKKHPAEAIAALAEALGSPETPVDIGESYIQEAQAKQQELADAPVRWHFIGKLQSNKAKLAAGEFALVHSVDSLKLARMLHKRAESLEDPQDILLQVNLGREPQKSGVDPENAAELAENIAALSGLRLVGLMTMPPFGDPEQARPIFAGLRRLRDELVERLGLALPELSMGMSDDFIQAIEEGATLVRIGTRIFGPREY
jgi:hypothetical protein